MRQPRFSLEDRVRSHTNMLLDPCGSVLGQTAYRGMDGFVNRFVNTNVLPFVAGKTGFIHTFYPAYNSTGTQVLNAADSVPVIPLSVGPGQGFMLQNASSQRAIAACCSVTYTGTELNRSGSIYMANLPLSALEGNKSPNELLRLCQHVIRTPDSTIDVKWNPSPIEEEYWTVGAAAPTDGGARNVIVIVGVGFASDTVINVTSATLSLLSGCHRQPLVSRQLIQVLLMYLVVLRRSGLFCPAPVIGGSKPPTPLRLLVTWSCAG
jgi:hypothetical protein